MLYQLKSILYVIMIGFITLCQAQNQKDILLLNLEFDISSNELKKEIDKMVDVGDLIMELKGSDTLFYKFLNLGNYTNKMEVYFNDDALKTGPLRSYTYRLSTLPYSKTGNDTISKKGYDLTWWEVIKESDLKKIKDFIDNEYGKGILLSPDKTDWPSDKVFKYDIEKAVLSLSLGKLNDIYGNEVSEVSIKEPFYNSAWLKVKSKNYSILYNKEKLRIKSKLKPEDVLEVRFKEPYLETDPDTFEKLITLEVFYESFKTYALDNDAIEFKGILSITDAYGDILFEADDFVYVFNTPLFNLNKNEWRTVRYPVYTLNTFITNYDKIVKLISLGSKLDVKLKPTAVRLDNGDVIK